MQWFVLVRGGFPRFSNGGVINLKMCSW